MASRPRPGTRAARALSTSYPQRDTQNVPARPARAGSVTLLAAEPDMAREWHPDRNGDWTPATIAQKSNLYAWWRCADGHEWRTRVNNRVAGRLGCPECFALGVNAPKRPLSETHPQVAAQWHPRKNGRLTPADVAASSMRLIWWRCTRDHVWRATVHSRATTRTSCGECADLDLLVGPGGAKADAGIRSDSIALHYPEIAAQWHPTKNGDLVVVAVPERSDVRHWWLCGDCGHEWRATPSRRRVGDGCPRCRRALLQDPLAARFPGLAPFWDSKRNGVTAKRARVVLNTDVSYWWTCPAGHSYEQSLSARVACGPGCAVCSGRKIDGDANSLAVINPAAAALWHPTRNGSLTASDVAAGTTRRVWWLCTEGHDWEAEVRSWLGGRTGYAGCHVCRDQERVARRDDRASAARAYRLERASRRSGQPIAAALAAQWHPTKNAADWPGGPFSASRFSRRSAWWLCECGHEWFAHVGSRAGAISKGHCPACGGHWKENVARLEPFANSAHPLLPLIEQGLGLAMADRLVHVAGLTSADQVASGLGSGAVEAAGRIGGRLSEVVEAVARWRLAEEKTVRQDVA